jgi:ectoine hydroxylase-related dioxygenase (phytanoyl-CoA dioxygenase family)
LYVMARKMFTDEAQQREFDRKGYVIVDLLDSEGVKNFVALNNELNNIKDTKNTYENTYELSFFERDIASKKKKFDAFYGFLKNSIDKYLIDYKPIIINLFSKEPESGEVPVHQNWTFVDEKKYTSVSVWCPLQDVSRRNGTLEVVPGTHKVIADVRGPGVTWVFENLVNVMIEKHMEPFIIKAGQAAIIDDSVIHFSADNHTKDPRIAVQLIMKPAEAQTIHYSAIGAQPGKVDVYEVEDDFFFDFDMREKPKNGKLVDSIDYQPNQLTESELIQRANINLSREPVNA